MARLFSRCTLAAALTLASSLAVPVAAEDTTPAPAPAPVAEADVDPFIWLEETKSERALAWVQAENEKTLAALTSDPRFETLRSESLAIFNAADRIPTVGFTPHGLINFWQDAANPRGLVRRTTLASYRTDSPVWETILDIDALAKAEGREWVYQGMSCLPPAGTRCMVSLSDGGKDASVMREFDITTKAFVEGGFTLAESQGGAEWVDENTLLVGRDFGPGTLTPSFYPFTTREWKRGTKIEDAPEIFRGDAGDVWAGAYQLRDAASTVHARMAFRGTSFFEREYFVWKDGAWLKLDLPKKAAPYGIVDGQILFTTDVDWETGGQTFPADSLVSADLAAWKADPNGAKKTLVWAPGKGQTKQGGAITATGLYVELLDNVRGQLLRFDHRGGKWTSRRVPLPDNATIGISASSDRTDELLITVTDFLTPSTVYYAKDGAAPSVIKTSPKRFNADGMNTEQFMATSRDGTKIPYFVVTAKGMRKDSSAPTLLTGYGGFQVPRVPAYLGSTGKLWVERGGTYVLANLRGGGEFGPKWHQTAMRANKQRTWDDFIAVAEDLIARGFTSPKHLGIQGGSQGGLLVGTAFTQRPDLFNAAVVQIPLFDMLRYHEIGRGASWIGEYGDPRIPEERAWIEGYSPYQKLLPGKTFPRIMYVTSTADDRTHPSHGRKAAARMAANGQPYLYYEDMTGGHSGGVDNEQRARLQALQFVYLLQQLKGPAGE
jgi:prolyl oligopeptidase